MCRYADLHARRSAIGTACMAAVCSRPEILCPCMCTPINTQIKTSRQSFCTSKSRIRNCCTYRLTNRNTPRNTLETEQTPRADLERAQQRPSVEQMIYSDLNIRRDSGQDKNNLLELRTLGECRRKGQFPINDETKLNSRGWEERPKRASPGCHCAVYAGMQTRLRTRFSQHAHLKK